MTKFEDLTKPELVAVGEMFGTDIHPNTAKPKMISMLGDDGVTVQMYLDAVAKTETPDEDEPVELTKFDDAPLDDDPEEPEVDEDEAYIVKMTRKNKTYQVRGYEFTQDHPYALVREDDADYLIETGGFRIAGPKEIKEYYGRL